MSKRKEYVVWVREVDSFGASYWMLRLHHRILDRGRKPIAIVIRKIAGKTAMDYQERPIVVRKTSDVPWQYRDDTGWKPRVWEDVTNEQT